MYTGISVQSEIKWKSKNMEKTFLYTIYTKYVNMNVNMLPYVTIS